MSIPDTAASHYREIILDSLQTMTLLNNVAANYADLLVTYENDDEHGPMIQMIVEALGVAIRGAIVEIGKRTPKTAVLP